MKRNAEQFLGFWVCEVGVVYSRNDGLSVAVDTSVELFVRARGLRLREAARVCHPGRSANASTETVDTLPAFAHMVSCNAVADDIER